MLELNGIFGFWFNEINPCVCQLVFFEKVAERHDECVWYLKEEKNILFEKEGQIIALFEEKKGIRARIITHEKFDTQHSTFNSRVVLKEKRTFFFSNKLNTIEAVSTKTWRIMNKKIK